MSAKQNIRVVVVGLSALSTLQLGFVRPGETLQVQGTVNARSSADFRSISQNVKFVLPAQTDLVVNQVRKFNSGNYGFYVTVQSGPYRGEQAWVYYRVENPRLRLVDKPIEQAAPREPAVTIQPTPATDKLLSAPEQDDLERWMQNQALTPIPTKPVERSQTPAAQSAPLQTNNSAPSPSITPVASERADTCVSCSSSPLQNRLAEPIRQVIRAGSSQLVVGARQTMAVMYQNCNVLNQDLYTPGVHPDIGDWIQKEDRGHYKQRYVSPRARDQIVRNHHYLQGYRRSAPQCPDLTQAPPVFIYGARPRFEGQTIDIHSTHRAGSAVRALDCSAFASVALSVAGLKLHPSVKSPQQNMFTSTQLIGLDGHNSCFERVHMQAGQPPIQPGDIFSVNGHVMIVDQVGEDPFGIARLKREGRFPKSAQACYGFPPPADYLNFSIIQSSAAGDMPAMRIHAGDYVRPFRSHEGIVYNRFRDLFEAACLAEFGRPTKVKNRRGSTLIRHKGTEECRFAEHERPKLKGMECSGDCLKEALQ
ncbi:MAG: hypothetical protein N2Z70_00105 [Bdellovibrionaceae bacterium]|jgi:hypothetical protein|nr:hypothetical protein [Pseudobdellovibrionaceae bacterium]